MISIAFISLGFALLVLQTATATLIETHTFSPNLLLPITIYVGVNQEIAIARGALIAFVLGYFLDAFCGSPMGLQTFISVATFMVARSAGIRLFLQGVLFQVILTFAISLIAGGTLLALQAIFRTVTPFPSADYPYSTRVLFQSSVVTALLTPFIFIALRKLTDWLTQRTDEGSAAP
ncbi:MAG: rod shape-determining protein MreD [Deltaproteobacteria bacterium]|nr:rod shape-determining protein MreD [Deltaproteobacteria bacterium]